MATSQTLLLVSCLLLSPSLSLAQLWVLLTHVLDLVHSDEDDKVNSLTKPEEA